MDFPTKHMALIRAVALLAIILVVALVLFLLPTKRYVVNILAWIETLGAWGPILLSISYIVATILLLPGSILAMGAGALFGVWKGFLAMGIGAYLGACGAFLLGRTLARDWVEKKMSENARFSAIEKAIGKQGFKIVLLLRLCPLFPFNLLNYSLGLTPVRFSHYAIASLVGMIPAGFMYVYIGAAAGSLAAITAGEPAKGDDIQLLKWIGLAVTIVATVLLTRIARKSLKAIVEQPEVGLESAEIGQESETGNPGCG
jgi:uncharacterized membrane protein YdjX (TVP38/TMEM64 family)